MATITYPTYVYDYTFTPVNVDTKVTVDTNIDVDFGDNPDGSIDLSKLFANFTTNAEIVEGEEGYFVQGEGVFDDLMETAFKHLDANFKSNRIKQEDYHAAHLQMYLATLQTLSGQLMQLEINRRQLLLQAAIESKRLEVQLALESKKMELELAVQNKQFEVQIEQGREQLESGERQNEAKIASQEKISDKELAQQKVISDEQLAQQKEISDNQLANDQLKTDKQLEMQWRIALLNDALEYEKLAVQLKIAEAQLALLEKQAEAEDAKKELYRRQIKGFDEDFKYKILKIMADAWGVAFSVGKDSFKVDAGGSFPAIMQTGTMNEFFNQLVYPEMENYEWKVDKHPDNVNKTKLTTTKSRTVNVEKYS